MAACAERVKEETCENTTGARKVDRESKKKQSQWQRVHGFVQQQGRRRGKTYNGMGDMIHVYFALVQNWFGDRNVDVDHDDNNINNANRRNNVMNVNIMNNINSVIHLIDSSNGIDIKNNDNLSNINIAGNDQKRTWKHKQGDLDGDVQVCVESPQDVEENVDVFLPERKQVMVTVIANTWGWCAQTPGFGKTHHSPSRKSFHRRGH